MAAGSSNEGGDVTCSDPESGGLSGRMSAHRIEKHNIELFPSTDPLKIMETLFNSLKIRLRILSQKDKL
jgi:hypothetical protein